LIFKVWALLKEGKTIIFEIFGINKEEKEGNSFRCSCQAGLRSFFSLSPSSCQNLTAVPLPFMEMYSS